MKLTKIIVIITAFFCFNDVMAQTINNSVKGRVISETNIKPLQSATITIVGAKKGTATDAQGAFTIKLPDDTKQYKILVAYTGYLSKEISV
jgi:iron complex outermembrane receptor protein